MKKTIITIGLSSIIALTGCADKAKDQGMGAKNHPGNPTNVNNPTQYYDEDYRNNDNKSDDFGFTRTNSATIDGRNISNKAASIDREQLSDVITKLSVQIPNVNDAATLVTDEEVLVVYDTNAKDRTETADQVKRTAMSVVPRYYHVYVSDDYQTLAQDVENFSTLKSGSKGIDYTIEQTIKRMLKSPQGYKMSDEENENGEMVNDKRDHHDNIHQKMDNR
ncbi:YhcN/YlaJ family sporulation lipoprotein [Bacillus sp. ISL-4]|uniref:YhcN/YlaJ family sporulation lipoprotein n=1 Tax=Bacillus sp. ISL-4 TaxID=2819125 RepID=UPI001BEA3D71|nr:YhcN/YlaJ family sporulation lipoprotein [Bacillus sp. ISL-4]MBT2666474.1 YhcN/YlaJ family sporulation lipoprotein [Bacillus sp. ISL-4]MBT2670970.1 YhcN/YlaJ family sporulation lipoprotein [Streptomyces sp. ISL-14]